jgi:hypothetical protein
MTDGPASVEVPVEDALEQEAAAFGEVGTAAIPPDLITSAEVNEADAVEQALVVDDDEDYDR